MFIWSASPNGRAYGVDDHLVACLREGVVCAECVGQRGQRRYVRHAIPCRTC